MSLNMGVDHLRRGLGAFTRVPDGLRTWLTRVDWGVVVTLLLALIAVAPFLTRPGLPRGTDAELHVYRAAELGRAIREGVLYPRWAPNLYLGYGYPIFNYYAPLTYYLANLFALVPGWGVVAGVKGVFVLGLVLAALGSYLLGRGLFDAAGGVLCAASYTFAPYVVFIDPHARGDLAEHFAICLLPLTLHAFRRVVRGRGGRGAFLTSVLFLAALVFSHNLLGLIAGGLLALYWLWAVASGGARRAGWGVAVCALAAALIAFFWLPALLEWSLVDLTVTGPGHFDFREHFLSLGELLAPMPLLDLGATGPQYPFTLGLAQWVLALPALVLLVRRGRAWRELLYFALAGLGMGLLMLPLTEGIWEWVPRMEYLQFPWRLLGPANLMLAVCAAGISALVPRKARRGPVLGGALLLFLALSWPALYPPMWAAEFGGTTAADVIEWEIHSGAYGTTSTGDFVPQGAVLAPIYPEPALLASHVGGGPVDKVNRAVLPEGAEVTIVDRGSDHEKLHVSTPEKFLLRLYTFYFPGWHAYVDGQEVEIEVAGPEGFITFWIPAGEHEVTVRFEDTPSRRVGWLVSGVGLLGLLGAAWVFPGARREKRQSPGREGLWLLAAVVGFAGVKGLVVDPQDGWLRYTSPPGQAWAAQHEQRTDFGGQIELLGYDLPRRRVRSGDEFPVVLYWHALEEMDVNYQAFVHVTRPLHLLWGQEDHLNPGGLPTTRWPLNRYVWDAYEVEVLPGTPPGEYVLNVGVYSMDGGYRLPRHDEMGRVAGDSLPLTSITVERPRRQPDPAELEMTHPLTVTFPEAGVTLLGYRLVRPKVKLPGAWEIVLFWRAERDQPAARVRDFVMAHRQGQEVWRVSGPPADYAFARWRAGEIVRDPIVFTAVSPVSLTTGKYPIGIVLSGERPISPEGTDEAFVPIGRAEFRVKENE